MRNRVVTENFVLNNFENALKAGEIVPFFQPEVRTVTGEICGFESLARWISPDVGMIPPCDFISTLEKYHLCYLLDFAILDKTCKAIKEIRACSGAYLPISINISRSDFDCCDVLTRVKAILDSNEIPYNKINIEITESAINSNYQFILNEVIRFRNAGFEVWMDDFGNGQSTLNNVKDYSFDLVKLDMGFLVGFDENCKTKQVISTIIYLAKNLGMQTLSEGVETKEQYEFLKLVGCEKVQGFLFSKPISLEELLSKIKDGWLPLESDKNRAFYSDIGKVNVLSDNPIGAVEESDESLYESTLPLAIYEFSLKTEKLIRYNYKNEQYERYMRSIGYDDIQESSNRINAEDKVGAYKSLVQHIRNCVKSGRSESSNYVTNSNIVSVTMRCVARNDEDQLYAIAVTPINLTARAETRQIKEIHNSMQYLFGTYDRVDLLDPQGAAENIYLDSSQEKIAENGIKTAQMLKEYARKYVREDDQDRFLRFNDLSDICRRVAKRKAKKLISFFYSKNSDDDEYSLHSYQLIVIATVDSLKVLFCVSDMDNIDQECLESVDIFNQYYQMTSSEKSLIEDQINKLSELELSDIDLIKKYM